MRLLRAAKVLTDGAMTGTAVLTSAPVGMADHVSGSFQFVWTGTPNGSFAIEGSLDGTNWSDMGATITAASGAAGNRLYDITVTGVPLFRAKYTNTSSTGTLQIYFAGKGN